MFKPGDKVRIKDGFYKGMEGHIEGINYEDRNSHTVALNNDDGCVNTMLPPSRLEPINDSQAVTHEMVVEIERLLSKVGICLSSIAKENLKN